ncbi:MAG TPA: SH3-like domain-containing protein [Streptosporangiaceae bacterium]|nr:SH3-like domain-containing protein [Streptosporangiaceae bacterium]
MARFSPGDRVRALATDPDGHTRLPRYARGHVGEVLEVRATWALPDETVRGNNRREPVYAVRFGARELWGEGSHAVILDLWESYLEDERAGRKDE